MVIKKNALGAHIEHIYAQLQHNFGSTLKKNSISETNGEILSPDKSRLFTLINFEEQDIFYDLGAGTGKVIVQAYLETCAKKIVGIEIREDLHAISLAALSYIKTKEQENPGLEADNWAPQKELPNSKRIISHFGSFFTIPFHHEATVIFINSTCFTQAMLFKIGVLINSSHTIRCVISFRPLYNLHAPLRLDTVLRLQCSWDAVLCYIYRC